MNNNKTSNGASKHNGSGKGVTMKTSEIFGKGGGFMSYMTCAKCGKKMSVVSFPDKDKPKKLITITSHDEGCN